MKLSFRKVLSAIVIAGVILSVSMPVSAAEQAANIWSKPIVRGLFGANSLNTDSVTWRTNRDGWSIISSPETLEGQPAVTMRNPYIAKFNAYDEMITSSSMLTKEKIDLSQAISVTVSYYMYHCASSLEDSNDFYKEYVQPCFSNGVTISGISSEKVYRYNGTTGWAFHTATFTVPEKNSYYLGLRGVSDNGYNFYIDEVSVSVQLEDKTPPTSPSLTLDNTKFTNKKVTVTLTNGTDVETGVGHSEYRIGNSGGWQTYVKPFSVDNNKVVYARTIDKGGLISKESSISINNIDKTAPKIIVKVKKKTIKNKAKVRGTVTVKIKEKNLRKKTATKGKKKIKWPKNNKFSKKGKYSLAIMDKAGNKTTFAFTVK